MLRNTNAEMVLPMNAVKMTEDEMMYVEGGGASFGYAEAIIGGIVSSVPKWQPYGAAATISYSVIKVRATNPFTAVHHDRGNTYRVSYSGSIKSGYNGNSCKRVK